MSKKLKKWTSIVEEEVILSGTLEFEHSLVIKGRFQGKIKTQGNLTIESTAKVQADIEAKSIFVAGQLSGDCLAYEKFELLLTSKYKGKIKTKKLKIADGVKFQGKCEMIH